MSTLKQITRRKLKRLQHELQELKRKRDLTEQQLTVMRAIKALLDYANDDHPARIVALAYEAQLSEQDFDDWNRFMEGPPLPERQDQLGETTRSLIAAMPAAYRPAVPTADDLQRELMHFRDRRWPQQSDSTKADVDAAIERFRLHVFGPPFEPGEDTEKRADMTASRLVQLAKRAGLTLDQLKEWMAWMAAPADAKRPRDVGVVSTALLNAIPGQPRVVVDDDSVDTVLTLGLRQVATDLHLKQILAARGEPTPVGLYQHPPVFDKQRPWMEALEMQFRAARRFGEIGVGIYQQGAGASPFEAQYFAEEDQRILRRAECYSWGKEPLVACQMAAKSLPLGSILNRSVTPGHTGWWYFPGPLPVKTTWQNDEVCALLWSWGTGTRPVMDDHVARERLLISLFVMARYPEKGFIDYAPTPVQIWCWFTGETVADALARSEKEYHANAAKGSLTQKADLSETLASIRSFSLFFLAACTWVQQRVLSFSDGHVERHRRKQLTREHKLQTPPGDVKVIQLRRLDVQSGPRGPAPAGVDPIEWSCRWVVNGHWRNQYYPGVAEHRLIYILPFVKGPADKPLKVPKSTVFTVTR